MTDDEQSPSLGDLLGDLPPLPDTVWERLLATALDPNTPGDADLVPEMTDVPVLPDDEPELDGALLDDTDTPVDHDDQSTPPLHHTDDHHHHDGGSGVPAGDELQVDLDLDHLGTDPSDTPEPHPDDDLGGPDLGGPDLGPGWGEDIH
jgi:hypothetical protein